MARNPHAFLNTSLIPPNIINMSNQSSLKSSGMTNQNPILPSISTNQGFPIILNPSQISLQENNIPPLILNKPLQASTKTTNDNNEIVQKESNINNKTTFSSYPMLNSQLTTPNISQITSLKSSIPPVIPPQVSNLTPQFSFKVPDGNIKFPQNKSTLVNQISTSTSNTANHIPPPLSIPTTAPSQVFNIPSESSTLPQNSFTTPLFKEVNSSINIPHKVPDIVNQIPSTSTNKIHQAPPLAPINFPQGPNFMPSMPTRLSNTNPQLLQMMPELPAQISSMSQTTQPMMPPLMMPPPMMPPPMMPPPMMPPPMMHPSMTNKSIIPSSMVPPPIMPTPSGIPSTFPVKGTGIPPGPIPKDIDMPQYPPLIPYTGKSIAKEEAKETTVTTSGFTQHKTTPKTVDDFPSPSDFVLDTLKLRDYEYYKEKINITEKEYEKLNLYYTKHGQYKHILKEPIDLNPIETVAIKNTGIKFVLVEFKSKNKEIETTN